MWQRAKNVYHLFVAVLANIIYQFPAKKLIVIGVTGTDGKTTTTSLIYHILKTANLPVSMVSTVSAIINGESYDTGFHVTNPSSVPLQKFLKKALLPDRNTKSYLVLEVTSHGIDQNRIWGIPFTFGVLTNITHEHLDYHKTFENYLDTKVKLLQRAKIAVINRDDDSYKRVSAKLSYKSKKIITYGLQEDADVNPEVFSFTSNLNGEFNKYNVLAAVSVVREIGVKDEVIREAIKTFTPPAGRGEIVYDKDFTVMVDFAHTPNSFQELLSNVKPQVTSRVIHVFGCAGERDVSKRPVMGKISAKYADIIILTAEDPRCEGVDKINADIKSGIKNPNIEYRISKQIQNFKIQNDKKYLFEVSDRQEAINAAVGLAKKGDFVLLTGKAHEKSMNYGKGEEAWDEFEAVKKATMNI